MSDPAPPRSDDSPTTDDDSDAGASTVGASLHTHRSRSETVLTPKPRGTGFNIEQHKAEERAQSALHRRQQEAADAEHRRTEAMRRNQQRRRHEQIMFYGIIGTLAGVLMIALVAALFWESADTREWGRSLVVLIVGGLVGGLAGYITGQASSK